MIELDSTIVLRATVTLICWGVMIAAVFIDLWTGIDKAKALGERVHSQAMRRTVTKIGEYWRVLAMFLLFDIVASFVEAYNLPYGSMLGTICVLVIEVRSVFENLSAKRSVATGIPDVLTRILKCKDREMAQVIVNEFKHSAQ